MFISIEGIDGSGKSTVTSELRRSLTDLGKTCVVGYQPTNWLKRVPVNLECLSNLEIIALFSADRGFDQELLAMQIDQNDIVIRDRYCLSTYAYNCSTEIEIGVYEGLSRNFIKPDLTVLIDTPVAVCLERISKRQNKQNLSYADLTYFERKSLTQVRDRYLRKLSLINWSQSLVVDGLQSVESIASQILAKAGVRLAHKLH